MAQHILEHLDRRLLAWLAEQGEPGFRARQIRHWLFDRRAESFDQMNELPKKLREALARDYVIWSGEVERVRQAEDGTEKLLLRLEDGERIECVLLRDGYRRSICISTQVGCAMGCVFCASGLDGVKRNLRRGEILEQMLRLQQRLPPQERISHIVVMGMGEPLANLDNLLAALAEATSREGLRISARRITISTVGLPAAIDRLAALGIPYHLAVSLHAPDNALRSRLVPVNRKIGMEAILAAADRYFHRTGRKLTFEYVLLRGINDTPNHARKLAALLRGRTALLNVIPYNPVAGLPYQTPDERTQRRFEYILRREGINVYFRERKGDAIDAACGQLRRISEASHDPQGAG
ncbi:MAG: putative dual-specificity RNA methyltransferase RlmN [Pirellulaceae bacterium]|nr:MAG: putative dual-specificity RNA methyltransferase RlmN [Pirellulaceae bacterium]